MGYLISLGLEYTISSSQCRPRSSFRSNNKKMKDKSYDIVPLVLLNFISSSKGELWEPSQGVSYIWLPVSSPKNQPVQTLLHLHRLRWVRRDGPQTARLRNAGRGERDGPTQGRAVVPLPRQPPSPSQGRFSHRSPGPE